MKKIFYAIVAVAAITFSAVKKLIPSTQTLS